MEHGIEVGDLFDPTEADCRREPTAKASSVSADASRRLVIFATDADCALCVPHLEQMTTVVERLGGRADVTLMFWAPNEAAARRALRISPIAKMVPVCLASDEFWKRQEVDHTPFTLLVEGNRVAGVVDGEIENNGAAESIVRWVSQE